MGEQAGGSCDIDEERGQSDTRREPFLQMALREAGEYPVDCARLIAKERLCREARLPPAGEATTEHGYP
jgi:hypothetical protein